MPLYTPIEEESETPSVELSDSVSHAKEPQNENGEAHCLHHPDLQSESAPYNPHSIQGYQKAESKNEVGVRISNSGMIMLV
jgi:hypothetical protein